MSEQTVRPEDEPEGAIKPEDLVQPDVHRPEVEEAPKEDEPEEKTYTTMESESSPDQSVSDVAQEVFRGEWGVGQEKRQKLQEAGYDVKAVEEEVIRLRNQ